MPDPQQQANPDAILYPGNAKRGRTQVDRATWVQKVLGPRLGGKDFTSLGPEHGGRVYSRDVGDGWFLATLNPDDTMFFAISHEYARHDRYRWEDQEDGTRNGFMLSAEELDEKVNAETPAERQAREASLAAVRKMKDDGQTRMTRWRELVKAGANRTPEEDEELRKLRNTPRFSRLIQEGIYDDPFAVETP